MELLRIAMDVNDIRSACAAWAALRTVASPDKSLFLVDGLPEKLDVLVVVRPKRARKAKAKA